MKEKTLLDKLYIFFFINLLVLLSSKMILVIIVICIILYLLFFKKNFFLKIHKSLITLVIFILTLALTSNQIIERLQEEKKFTNLKEVLTSKKFTKTYLWTGTSIRLFQLRLLKEQIQEDKILFKGYGLFASRLNLKERHEKYDTYKEFHGYNYHNQYAQTISDCGILGLLLLLLMLFVNFKKALKSKDFLFMAFSITLFMLFFTESFLWVQRGVIFTSVLFCLFNRTFYSTK